VHPPDAPNMPMLFGLVRLQQFAIDRDDIFIAGDRRPAAAIIDLDHLQLAEAGDGDRLGVHLELHQHLIAVLRGIDLGE
jgi:hypothetical protein